MSQENEKVSVGQGTTSTLSLLVEADLSKATSIVVSIRQDMRAYDFTGNRVWSFDDPEGTLLMVHLSQEETLSMRPKEAEIQVRWLDFDDEAYETDIQTIDIERALYKGVLQRGESE